MTREASFGGQANAALNHGPDAFGTWNHFVVEGVNLVGAPLTQAAFTTNPSMALVNNDGAASSVTLSFTGQYWGWNGSAGQTNLLNGDYLIFFNPPALGAPAGPHSFTLTGLTPNTQYTAGFLTGVDGARPINVKADQDGNGTLANNTNVTVPGGSQRGALTFTSSPTGTLIGEVDAVTGEGNLAGFQLALGATLPDSAIKVQVNRATGGMTMINNSLAPVNILGYQITSNAGALSPAGWLSIADNYDANSGIPANRVDATSTWLELTAPANRDNLSEVQDVSGTGVTIAVGQSVNLGNAWLQSPTQDLAFQVALSDGTTISAGLVEYVGNGGQPLGVGDFNGDGTVNVADWVHFKPGYGASLVGLSTVERYRKGDLNGDNVVDFADAIRFASAFDAANGEGALQALIASVPEPSSAALALLAVVAGLGVARRR